MSELAGLPWTLYTLVGWPLALPTTRLNELLLLIAIPAGAFALIAGAVKVFTARGPAQRSDPDYADPIWYGSGPAGQEATQADRGNRPAVTEGRHPEPGAEQGRGGASARW